MRNKRANNKRTRKMIINRNFFIVLLSFISLYTFCVECIIEKVDGINVNSISMPTEILFDQHKESFVITNETVPIVKDTTNKQILSRRRRYLSFPSGSSFQIGKIMIKIEKIIKIHLFFFDKINHKL